MMKKNGLNDSIERSARDFINNSIEKDGLFSSFEKVQSVCTSRKEIRKSMDQNGKVSFRKSGKSPTIGEGIPIRRGASVSTQRSPSIRQSPHLGQKETMKSSSILVADISQYQSSTKKLDQPSETIMLLRILDEEKQEKKKLLERVTFLETKNEDLDLKNS